MLFLKKLVSILVVVGLLMVVCTDTLSAQKPKVSSKSNLVNINTANAALLDTLPRVGEKIAQRIIEYRKKNGKFKKPQDLMKVKGIGEKTFAQMKHLITV